MDNTKKQYRSLWFIIAIVLLAGLLVMVWLYSGSRQSIKHEVELRVKESTSHQRELDSLTYEFENIKRAYGSLNLQLKGKDSIIQQNIIRINQLIASNSSKDLIIRELEQLRTLKQDYERRLDSLLYINMELTDKNLELKYRVEAEQEKNIVLTEEKEEFKRKAILGEKIRAYNISANGYHTRGSSKETFTDKARRTDRIKVCFTIGENLVIPSGDRYVYVRIAGPDNVILTRGEGDAYSFEYQGERLQFTMKQSVNYLNKPLQLCMNWDGFAEYGAIPGTYNISIFFGEQEIGKTSFKLN